MSVLLDTNVVSELIRKTPDPGVESRAADHVLEELFFSTISEAELRYGAAILPAGRRRATLISKIEAVLHDAFDGRVLPFDSNAARAYAEIAAMRRSAGRPVAPADCQIAAIARARHMTVDDSGNAQCQGFRGQRHQDRRSVGYGVTRSERRDRATVERVRAGRA